MQRWSCPLPSYFHRLSMRLVHDALEAQMGRTVSTNMELEGILASMGPAR
jgi:hypothetical protein